ncbi:transposase [Vibrio quintilis]|uniref:Transposase IS200-like domain-containing protein n=1 Tax=Vibrio quintilis TaxID=1117707 RepID=A0A1M7YYQ7_9VIBR|nr:transposase [Vibrio quintilis]SHO57715.1 hypothetical protein VQ7734_03485 [Vibrio quintilis]
MTLPRSQQVDLAMTPYYHCVSRCVRRSYLCGQDALSGRSYEHRRQWVQNRIHELAGIFCIDICAYAVMSNHYHLVVHINQEKAETLTDIEVIQRWEEIHHLPALITRYLRGILRSPAEIQACKKIILLWRQRLYSLSWLMKELNFDIALQANQEDGCTGHFWEGRFKSQALLDEKALLAAMTYTDLNPVRAQAAETPETSEYTSIKKRLDSLAHAQPTPSGLWPFTGQKHIDGLPFRFMDYIEWVDWVGRQTREGKPGTIPAHLPAMIDRLSLNLTDSLKACTQLEKKGCLWIGPPEQLLSVKTYLHKQRIHGISL